MKRFILNPFILYIGAYLFVIVLYQFKWSELFPPLGSQLMVFLIVTFFVSFILGCVFYSKKREIVSRITLSDSFFSKSITCISLGYFLEFIYAHQIPLLSVSLTDDSFIHFGGIPTFHVILVTYNVFFDIIFFQKNLQSKVDKRKWFAFAAIAVLPPIVIVNRGMLFTVAIACILMYLIMTSQRVKSLIIKCGVFAFVLLAGFALLGSLRIHDEGNRAFVSYAEPSSGFLKTNLNPLVLWPYMYIASPMANLQYCIDNAIPEYDFPRFITECICPDVISKRLVINKEISSVKSSNCLISPVFNVSTMYNTAYITMGYYGMLLMFFYQSFIVVVFLLISYRKKNQYYTVCFCLICSNIILGTFSNMWVFSAISFPILWSPIFNILSRCKITAK